ncbi:MAG: VanZ family protein [Oscillospiraceae bacterium]|nr:VanZ family protein [Oscillospiraceae bacterium]
MIKKRIFQMSSVLLMILIFYFSAQPADDSTETSSRFCILLARLLYPDYDLYDLSIREIITDGLTFIVRKAAHFTEYAVLGCLFYFDFHHQKAGFLFAVLLTSAYACTDEFHQLFVFGRSGQLRDVVIDTCGGLCGALAGFIILCIWYYLKHQKKCKK